MKSNQVAFLVGSYTNGPGACGEGITSFLLDMDEGSISPVSTLRELPNPAYLARIPHDEHRIAVACEAFTHDGDVAIVDSNPGHMLRVLSKQSSRGHASCHVAAHRHRLLVSNYSSGSLSLFRFHGSIIEPAESVVAYEGSSIDSTRQASPHAHQAVPVNDGSVIYVCDLGCDIVWMHRIADDVVGAASVALRVPPGSGPRHLCLHPTLPLAYLLCEISNRIIVARIREDHTFEAIQEIPGLQDATRSTSAAAIRMHPTGSTLYASFRGADVISAFAVQSGGSISFMQQAPAGGRIPRDFAIDPSGRWLIVALQHSNRLVSLPLHPTNHTIGGEIHSVPCGTPVCVLF
ncbi:lactonase family protein [Candidatus Sumerlaeota bacterium]|nr:lactonase family protein [Candidatus Sumerlaeota bacterium]